MAAPMYIQNNHRSNMLGEKAQQHVPSKIKKQAHASMPLQKAKKRPVFIHQSKMASYSASVYQLQRPYSGVTP